MLQRVREEILAERSKLRRDMDAEIDALRAQAHSHINDAASSEHRQQQRYQSLRTECFTLRSDQGMLISRRDALMQQLRESKEMLSRLRMELMSLDESTASKERSVSEQRAARDRDMLLAMEEWTDKIDSVKESIRLQSEQLESKREALVNKHKVNEHD